MICKKARLSRMDCKTRQPWHSLNCCTPVFIFNLLKDMAQQRVRQVANGGAAATAATGAGALPLAAGFGRRRHAC